MLGHCPRGHVIVIELRPDLSHESRLTSAPRTSQGRTHRAERSTQALLRHRGLAARSSRDTNANANANAQPPSSKHPHPRRFCSSISSPAIRYSACFFESLRAVAAFANHHASVTHAVFPFFRRPRGDHPPSNSLRHHERAPRQMPAQASGLGAEVLSEDYERGRRCCSQQQRAELPALLCYEPSIKDPEDWLVPREEDRQRCLAHADWVSPIIYFVPCRLPVFLLFVIFDRVICPP